MTWYLDTSALLKLVVAEPETGAMRTWWADEAGDTCSSDLLRTEALRAARRVSPEVVAAVRHLVDEIPLIRLDPISYEQAGTLDPPLLRSLDALHLTAARALGDDLDGLVTYDDRLAEAARLHGVQVVGPT